LAAYAYLVSYAGSTVLGLTRPGFVLLHVIASGAFVLIYFKWSGASWVETPRILMRGVAAGLTAAALLTSLLVIGSDAVDATSLEDLALGLLGLGVAYGGVDALLLTVAPMDAVRSTARASEAAGPRRRLATAALALSASAAVTALYHLGFKEFRGPTLALPLVGNTVVSLAYVLSASRAAPLIAHVGLHVAGVLLATGAGGPLPPHA
jgi:hypothetical protein